VDAGIVKTDIVVVAMVVVVTADVFTDGCSRVVDNVDKLAVVEYVVNSKLAVLVSICVA